MDGYGYPVIEPLDEFGQRMSDYQAWLRRQRWYVRLWVWLNSEVEVTIRLNRMHANTLEELL